MKRGKERKKRREKQQKRDQLKRHTSTDETRRDELQFKLFINVLFCCLLRFYYWLLLVVGDYA